jgi:hypothetical protein
VRLRLLHGQVGPGQKTDAGDSRGVEADQRSAHGTLRQWDCHFRGAQHVSSVYASSKYFQY